MKATIEYSPISRCYYVTADGFVPSHGFRRKDDAEREARRIGADEIEHTVRSATKSLRSLGFAPESARRVAKDFFQR